MTDNPVKVLVYSDNRLVRDQVRNTLGKKVAPDLPELEVSEVATMPALLRLLDADDSYGLLVLDGDAQPSGGFGISYQLHDEYAVVPPVVLLISRRDDTWLAAWSRADAVVQKPLDPFDLPERAAALIRQRIEATA